MKVLNLNGESIDLSNIETEDLIDELVERDEINKSLEKLTSYEMAEEVINRNEEDEVLGSICDTVMIQFIKDNIYMYPEYEQVAIIKNCDASSVDGVVDDWELNGNAIDDMDEEQILQHVFSKRGVDVGYTRLESDWLVKSILKLCDEFTSFEYLETMKQ